MYQQTFAHDKAMNMCSVFGCQSVAHANLRLCKHHKAIRGLTDAPLAPPKRRKKKLPRGKFGNGHGYVMVWVRPQFPGAFAYGSAGKWAIMEHRKIMGDMIGRAVLPGETVHHINGIRDDNRPENLELWVSSHPSGQRVSDQLAWARMIVDRYDGLNLSHHNSHGDKTAC